MHALDRNAPEPAHGSVVLAEGPTGTAYQRLHSTGRWHSSTGSATRLSWAELQAKTDRRGSRPLLLVHNTERDVLTELLTPADRQVLIGVLHAAYSERSKRGDNEECSKITTVAHRLGLDR